MSTDDDVGLLGSQNRQTRSKRRQARSHNHIHVHCLVHSTIPTMARVDTGRFRLRLLLILGVISFLVGKSTASTGDRLPEFKECVQVRWEFTRSEFPSEAIALTFL